MWLTLIGSPVSGSGIRQTSAACVLQVEDVGQGMGGAGERRMVDHVGDPRAIDPDFTIVLEAAEKLLAGASGHFVVLGPW